MLYDLFFTLLTVGEAKERDHRIKTALDQTDWTRSIRLEAAQWLRHHLSVYVRPDVRLQIENERWTLQAIDESREVSLYRIPYEVFGLDAFRGMQPYDVMTIDSQVLFQRLPCLLEKLTAAGITLLYEDQSLRTIRWDCSVQVGRQDREETGIEWFEIRPEIRCDGMSVNEAEWRQALRQGGLIRTTHGLRILDSRTMERLCAIIGLTGVTQADRKTAEVVRVPRLQILDWLALREQGIPVSLPAEDEAVLARLLGFERIEKPPLPKGVYAVLRPYRREGYALADISLRTPVRRLPGRRHGIGEDSPNHLPAGRHRGGTHQGGSRMKGPHLIVVPTSLLFNWDAPHPTPRPLNKKAFNS